MENGYKLGDKLVLVYTQEDLEDEDLGMSGIVLSSPLANFRYNLTCKYLYIGCLKEDEDRLLIQRIDHRGDLKGKPELITKRYTREWTREDEDAEWERNKWN